jgi:hypothetical protein
MTEREFKNIGPVSRDLHWTAAPDTAKAGLKKAARDLPKE